MRVSDNKKYVAIAMLILFSLLMVEAFFYLKGDTKKADTAQISVIVYGKDESRWENLRTGAEQACKDSNAEISFITMSSDSDAAEQCSLIDREVENGADAVIIAAVDSEKVGKYIKGRYYEVPVIFAETGIESEDYNLVSSDNYKLGQMLGKEIVTREKKRVKVAVVSDSMERDSVLQRYNGVMDMIVPYADSVVIWDRNENEKNMLTRKYLQRWLVEEAVDVVVTLDSETTDALMDALSNLNKTRKVYSIASSYKAIYNLDHNRILALSFQDEYGIGYRAVEEALVKLKLSDDNKEGAGVLSKIVVRSNMYSDDNEKLLFPVVK